MNTPGNTDVVINKIHKLLALADAARNSSEAEASLAAQKVQELLQEHNLSMSQVEAAGGATDGKRSKESTGRRAMYSYQRSLMAALAELNFCLHHISVEESVEAGKTRKSKRHILIGRQVNIQATAMTYDYLVTTMRRLVIEAGYSYGKAGERDLHYWLDGCGARICERLQDKRREREAADAARTAQASGNGTHRELVLTDVYGSERDLNNDVLNGFPPGTTLQRRLQAEAKAAAREDREKELIAQGVSPTEAFYQSHGYDAAKAKFYAKSWDRKQSRASRRGGRGRTQSWTRGNDNHYKKIASEAYQAGRSAGNDVGLDAQVNSNPTKRIR